MTQGKITSSTASPKKARRMPLFMLGLIILLFFGSAFGFYRYLQLQQELSAQTQQFTIKFAQLEKQQALLQQQFESESESAKQAQATWEQGLQKINKTMKNALKEPFYQSNDWLLLKARYYLELAQINAHWSDDSNTTLTLLQQADAILAPLHDQALFPIRQALAAEMVALRTQSKFDLSGLLSRIDAIGNRIEKLPFKSSPFEPQAAEENSNVDTATPNWKKRLQIGLENLKKLVVIQRHDKSGLRSLSPSYEHMLRETIYFNLQEAQWGLIHQNKAVYQFAMGQAIKNIKRSFQSQQPEAAAILVQLSLMQQMPLSAQPKNMRQSLILLNQLIDNRKIPKTEGDFSLESPL